MKVLQFSDRHETPSALSVVCEETIQARELSSKTHSANTLTISGKETVVPVVQDTSTVRGHHDVAVTDIAVINVALTICLVDN